MDIRPILSALARSRTGAVLVALQIAITLAVVCNAAFIVQQRLAKMDRPSGYDDGNVVTVQVIPLEQAANDRSAIAADLRALRAISGVEAASVTQQEPLSNSGINWGISKTGAPNDPDSINLSAYLFDEQGLDALGMKLIAGRWFRPEEVQILDDLDDLVRVHVPSLVVTQAVADILFPEGDALGQTVYDFPDNGMQIIGIVERAQGYFVSRPNIENSMFRPAVIQNTRQAYVIRSKPGDLDAVLHEVEPALLAVNPRRLVRHVRTLAEVREESYGNDRAMAITLLAVMGLLIAVTVLGVFGLMAFNVSRRRKQIGTRRALGAQRSDIVRYFLVESWLITTAGAVAGAVLAVALSVWLVNTFELPKLDWHYIPAGIVVLWVVAQLAAYGPARRASAIEPAIATRSV